ncbi:MAG: YeeE/YedE thiosulfate transporter family protein [Flavobacteriaceae bacterium]|nr:YeeE/YedE thiosulfate transporter family protein [Flavobacteriaceae bacterium]
MKVLKYLIVGVLFGIVLVKSEAVSWYRIYEMFRFQSVHMYGIIGTAVGLGIGIVYMIKKRQLRSIQGNPIHIVPKTKAYKNYLFGGLIFGLGWALVGACPGPMFILLATGYWSIVVVLFSAIAGTLVYGLFKDKLPH